MTRTINKKLTEPILDFFHASEVFYYNETDYNYNDDYNIIKKDKRFDRFRTPSDKLRTYLALAEDAYNTRYIATKEFDGYQQFLKGTHANGFDAVVYINSYLQEVVFSFGGTESAADIDADLAVFFKFIPNQIFSAGHFVKKVIKDKRFKVFKDFKVTFLGHSLGGLIAQCAAAAYQNLIGINSKFSVIAFESPGVQSILKQYIEYLTIHPGERMLFLEKIMKNSKLYFGPEKTFISNYGTHVGVEFYLNMNETSHRLAVMDGFLKTQNENFGRSMFVEKVKSDLIFSYYNTFSNTYLPITEGPPIYDEKTEAILAQKTNIDNNDSLPEGHQILMDGRTIYDNKPFAKAYVQKDRYRLIIVFTNSVLFEDDDPQRSDYPFYSDNRGILYTMFNFMNKLSNDFELADLDIHFVASTPKASLAAHYAAIYCKNLGFNAYTIMNLGGFVSKKLIQNYILIAIQGDPQKRELVLNYLERNSKSYVFSEDIPKDKGKYLGEIITIDKSELYRNGNNANSSDKSKIEGYIEYLTERDLKNNSTKSMPLNTGATESPLNINFSDTVLKLGAQITHKFYNRMVNITLVSNFFLSQKRENNRDSSWLIPSIAVGGILIFTAVTLFKCLKRSPNINNQTRHADLESMERLNIEQELPSSTIEESDQENCVLMGQTHRD